MAATVLFCHEAVLRRTQSGSTRTGTTIVVMLEPALAAIGIGAANQWQARRFEREQAHVLDGTRLRTGGWPRDDRDGVKAQAERTRLQRGWHQIPFTQMFFFSALRRYAIARAAPRGGVAGARPVTAPAASA
jgi:hypothetical protein